MKRNVDVRLVGEGQAAHVIGQIEEGAAIAAPLAVNADGYIAFQLESRFVIPPANMKFEVDASAILWSDGRP